MTALQKHNDHQVISQTAECRLTLTSRYGKVAAAGINAEHELFDHIRQVVTICISV